MDKIVSLRFTRRWGIYNAGEVAGFREAEAERIVAGGNAIYREAGDIPDELKDKLDPEGDGDSDDQPKTGEPKESGPPLAAPRDPSPLPEDFPARDALIDAGIDTVGAVPRTEEGLVALDGIGIGFARRILAALAELEAK